MNLAGKLAASLLAASLLTANASARTRLAPADEYFGQMKMSILEIRNRLHDLTLRCNVTPPKQSASIMHDALLIEDAIRDWKHKYPADPWISKDIASLVRIHVKLHTSHP